MVTFRGVRYRARQSVALFVIGALVVTGCVVAVGYARLTQLSLGSAGALLLLGVVAVAAEATSSVRARRPELALAQLHGARGFTLLWVAIAEPVLLLLAAMVVGVLAGWYLGNAAVHAWLSAGTRFAFDTAIWSTAAVVFGVAVVVVAAVSWRTSYEPLISKLDDLGRPREASPAGLFLNLLVIVAAVVAVYQANHLGSRHGDWVSLLSPALVGLAAGQIAIWLLSAATRVAARSRRLGRRFGWFLTVRRLTRRADVALLRLAVAAVVVAVVGANAAVGAGQWRDETARLDNGAPLRFAVRGGGLQAYAASHEADPRGRWLMAAVAMPSSVDGSQRMLYADMPRWDRVVGSFLAGTPAAGVADLTARLGSRQPVGYAHGNRASVAFTAASAHRTLETGIPHLSGRLGSPFEIVVDYVDDRGVKASVYIPRGPGTSPSPVGPGRLGYQAGLPRCARACLVTQVAIQGLMSSGPLRITDLRFGNARLLPLRGGDLTLSPTVVGPGRTHNTPDVTVHGAGIDVTAHDPYSPHRILVPAIAALPRAVTTTGLNPMRPGGWRRAYALDGKALQVRVVGHVSGLPFIGREGTLLDLATTLQRSAGQVPLTPTSILARADTPAAVLARLRQTGVVRRVDTVHQQLIRLEASGTGQESRLYTVIGVFGLLIAAVTVMASVVEQRRGRRQEAAGLRVVGINAAEVSQGYRGEAWLLGGSVALASGLAGWACCVVVLATLPLSHSGRFGLPPPVAPQPTLIASLAGLAGVFVGLFAYWTFRGVGRSSPPRLLREDQ